MKTLIVAIGAKYVHVNLAPYVLSAYAAEKGFRTEVLELNIGQPPDKMLRQVIRTPSNVVGISCYIWNVDAAFRLARGIKAVHPQTLVVLGGPEVTYRPEEALQQTGADACICGEGEQAFAELLACIQEGRFQGPVVLKADKQLPPEEWVPPFPNGGKAFERRILYMETSRGCPYQCGYCLSSVEQGVRALSAQEAVRQLIHLADSGPRLIKLVDRTFNFDKERAREIWGALIQRGGDVCWHFEVCAHLLDVPTLELLKTAPPGLFQFEIGVQSIHSQTLERIQRVGQFETIQKNVKQLLAPGNIHVDMDLICGLPGETYPDIAQSLNAVFALGPSRVHLGFLKLLHGCAMRNQARRYGMRFQPDAPYEVLATNTLSAQELLTLHDIEDVLDSYGNSGQYEATLKYLLEYQGLSPFGFFEGLAQYIRKSKGFDVGTAFPQKTEMLMGYLKENQLFDHKLQQTLAFDWLRIEGRELPKELKGVQVWRTANQPRSQKYARFAADIHGFMETGQWHERETQMCMDWKAHKGSRESPSQPE